MSGQNDARSISELFGDAVTQLNKLVHNELHLARVEISQKVSQASMGIAFIAAAAVMMIPVLVVLLFALALWIIQLGMSPLAAHLIAAAVGALLSAVLALVGMNSLRPEKLTPKVTIQQMERDLAAAKEFAK